jgi:AraC family transcriptional regulator, arabinose operon regulatory protein
MGGGFHDVRLKHPRGFRRLDLVSWALTWTVEGGGLVRSGGQEQVVGPGDVLVHPPGLERDLVPLDRPWWTRFCIFRAHGELLPLLQWPAGPGGVLHVRLTGPEQDAGAVACHERLLAAFRGQAPPRFGPYIYAVLQELLCWLGGQESGELPEVRDPRIQAAVTHMRQHLQQRLSVAALAHVTGLSPERFAHLFRQETGATPMRVLTGLRLELARERLRTHPDTLDQIARHCGFSGALQFSRAFRRCYGISPGAYRCRERLA